MNKKVIIYDDENIEYFTGVATNFGISRDDIEITVIKDLARKFIPGNLYCEFIVNEASKHDTIQLDETLMKRIAKYNKEKECRQIDEKIKENKAKIKELDKKIEEKKAKIKELDDILTDRVGRVEKLKEFIAKIYDIDLYDDDEDDDWE